MTTTYEAHLLRGLYLREMDIEGLPEKYEHIDFVTTDKGEAFAGVVVNVLDLREDSAKAVIMNRLTDDEWSDLKALSSDLSIPNLVGLWHIPVIY